MAKKEKSLNAKYEYKGEGELLSDISSSKPLKLTCENCKKEYKTKSGYNKHIKNCAEEIITEEIITEEIITEEIITVIQPSQKDIYKSMVSENRPFIIKINSNIIFDSDTNNIMILSFYDDHFRIGDKEYPYLGLNFKYKKN